MTEQANLEIRAFLALRGGSDTPERDIAALLRTSYPVARELRDMIADALEGRGGKDTISLTAGITPVGKRTRTMGARVRSLLRGKEARRLTSGNHSYEQAIEAVARDHCTPEKTVQRDYTLAGKAADWVSAQSIRVLPEIARTEVHGISWLEHIYLAALQNKTDPTGRLDAFLLGCEAMDRKAGLIK